MEKTLELEFGKKYRVGNFYVFKYNKVLRKSEVQKLRNDMGIPNDFRKYLERAQLPFIKIEAISGIWAMEVCCNTIMYQFINWRLPHAIKADEEGVVLENNTIADFAHMFAMFYTDTCVFGDSIYSADKANALKAFMNRQKAFKEAHESDEEKLKDDEELEAVKKDEETRAKIIDMAEQLKKGGNNEGN